MPSPAWSLTLPSRAEPAALLLAASLLCLAMVAPNAVKAQTEVEIAAGFAPPPLPLYDQPPLPGPDYLWSPGYWSWDDEAEDYYWVPGAWVLPPEPGYLWTPAWWGWNDGLYVFHRGYWGPHVGYYGGVAYGYGYTGSGFVGGYWSGGHYVYNQSVNHLSVGLNIAVYRGPAPPLGARTSFSGGPGGVFAPPTRENSAAEREAHIPATPQQAGLARSAATSPSFFAHVNRGAPPVSALRSPSPGDRAPVYGGERGWGGGPVTPRGGAAAAYPSRAPYEGSGGGPYAPRGPSPQAGAAYADPGSRSPIYRGGPRAPQGTPPGTPPGAPQGYGGGASHYPPAAFAAPPPPSGPPRSAAPAREGQRPPPGPAAERRGPPGRNPDPHQR